MTKHSFCAVAAQRSGEAPIGTAGHYQTYVLLECPYPWATSVFDSPQIPLALRQLIANVSSQQSIRFLCINRAETSERSHSLTRLLIYDAIHPVSAQTSSLHYRGFEFVLNGLHQVVECLQRYWQGFNLGKPIAAVKDVLVCTHGMRDKCCARFGQPFFKAAERLVAEQALQNVRVWRVSHIGGHRFAPTAIVLPEGRYYARLTTAALQAVLTHTGAVSTLRPMYRGWGLLPQSLQVLERDLFLQIGWQWLDYRLSYRIVDEAEDTVRATLTAASPENTLTTYQVTVVKSRCEAHRIHTDCNAQCPFVPVQYAIATLSTTAQHTKPCSPAHIPASKSGE